MKDINDVKVLQSGYLRKLRKGAQWKRRWVELTPKGWSYYKQSNDTIPLRTIHFDGNLVISIEYSKKGDPRLSFSCPEGNFLFQFTSLIELETWYHYVRHCVLVSGSPYRQSSKKYLQHQETRERTFFLWINFILKEFDIKIDTPEQLISFQILSEIKLILEELPGFKVFEKTIDNAFEFHDSWEKNKHILEKNQLPSLNMLELCLWFEVNGIRSLCGESLCLILKGNMENIFTFVWELIILYYKSKSSSIIINNAETIDDVRKEVLLWCSKCYHNYFGTYLQFHAFDCFQDGLTLCAIIHYFLPSQIPKFESKVLRTLDLRIALDILYSKLQMIPLLYAHNFESSIDEQSIILFILELENTLKSFIMNSPSVERKGNNINDIEPINTIVSESLYEEEEEEDDDDDDDDEGIEKKKKRKESMDDIVVEWMYKVTVEDPSDSEISHSLMVPRCDLTPSSLKRIVETKLGRLSSQDSLIIKSKDNGKRVY